MYVYWWYFFSCRGFIAFNTYLYISMSLWSMIIIFFAAAEGVWSGLVSYCFFRFSGSWFQSRHTLSGQRSLLLQQQLHSIWQRVLEMLDWQGSEAWLHQNLEIHVTHLYPQWIFVQSKNEICRTLLPASAVSPRAWLLCFNVIILSSCNASGLVPLNDFTLLLSGDKSNCESRWGNKKGLHADANSSHLHGFLWKKKDRLFFSEKTKNHQFLFLILDLFVGAGLEAFWGRQPGFGCPCWVGYVESSCFRSHLFETMRFGAIWFTPDKTLGYVWNWADHSEVISISPGTLADWDVSTPGQTADSLFSRRLLSGESVSNSFTLQSPLDAKHNEVMHMFKKRMRLQL